MSVRSRVVFAAGAAGAVGAGLLLSGRYDGSVVLAAFLVFSIRSAAAASSEDDGAVRLSARALLAPIWALAIAGAAIRAGSTELVDVRGANAVAGLALAHGPAATVAGAWLLFAATALAVAAGPSAALAMPEQTKRLEGLGVLAEAVLAVTLFLGPQIATGTDAVWWVAGIAALVAGSFLVHRALPVRNPIFGLGAAALGLVLVLVGGAP